jgi:F420H(2)-dependent quinone reductase
MPLVGEYEPSPYKFTREHVEVYEASDGAERNEPGMKVVVVTTVGAKSGKLRKFAVMRVEHDGVYAVVASKGGADTNPVWVHNLLQNPHVELQDEATKQDMVARVASGDEREEWWQRAVETFPPYGEYQTRTDRQIPVFIVEPVK